MSMRHSSGLWALCFLVVGLAGQAARGGVGASATISSTQLGPNSYEYSLTLNNTGTTPIGTFWYGWVPFYDLLPTAPTQITSPSGWTGINAPDYYGVASVQWVNTQSPLQPGQSLSGFKFDSSDSPATLEGTTFGYPINYSYVYIGAPQTDPGSLLTAAVVTPEPTTLGLSLAGVALFGCRRGRRRNRA